MKLRNLLIGTGLTALVGSAWLLYRSEPADSNLNSSFPVSASTPKFTSPDASSRPSSKSKNSHYDTLSPLPSTFSFREEDDYTKVQEILSNMSYSHQMDIFNRFEEKLGEALQNNLNAAPPSAEFVLTTRDLESISPGLGDAVLVGLLYEQARITIELHSASFSERHAHRYIDLARSLASDKMISILPFEQPLVGASYQASWDCLQTGFILLSDDFDALGREIASYNDIDTSSFEKDFMNKAYQVAEDFATIAYNNKSELGGPYFAEMATDFIDYGLNIAEQNGWEDAKADFLALEGLLSQ